MTLHLGHVEKDDMGYIFGAKATDMTYILKTNATTTNTVSTLNQQSDISTLGYTSNIRGLTGHSVNPFSLLTNSVSSTLNQSIKLHNG